MRIVMLPVDMIAMCDRDGKIEPIRFNFINSVKEKTTVNVGKVIHMDAAKHGDNSVYIYRCKSVFAGVEGEYELKFEILTCKWFLYRI